MDWEGVRLRVSRLTQSHIDELNIMMEHYYHFQAPIKAYSPRDVIKKLQDGISAYGLRINSKLDVNSKRTAESEKTIDVSWYDMYRHKHLWYKNVLDIGSGTGIFSIYSSFAGAKNVYSLEPEDEGSSELMLDNFFKLIHYKYCKKSRRYCE